MWLSIYLITAAVYFSPINFYQYLYPATLTLNQLCLNFNPIHSSYENTWNALVCGQSLINSEFSNQLKAAGLLHIFVISGSHFYVLNSMLKWLRVPGFISLPFLLAFNLISGFSAPGTRACLSLFLFEKLKINAQQKILLISILTLTLNPDWIVSFSFWLSWLASLILEISPKDKFKIIQNFAYYLTWIFLGQNLSIWSLPLNILIAPFIGWVLFPLSLLSFVPGIDHLFSFTMSCLEFLLVSLDIDQKKVPFGFQLWGLSLLTLLSHFFIMALDLRKQGQKLS